MSFYFSHSDQKLWLRLDSLDAICKFVQNRVPAETAYYNEGSDDASPTTYTVTRFEDESLLIMAVRHAFGSDSGTWWPAEVHFWGKIDPYWRSELT